MDGERWKTVYRMAMEVGMLHHTPRVQYSDSTIALIQLWCAFNNQPVAWGCMNGNWPEQERDWPKPSESTMSRRLRTASVRGVLEEILSRCSLRPAPSLFRYIDGKPLPIGGASGDPDAGFGRAAGGTMAKGYKLHVIWDSSGAIVAWDVEPINVQEKVVARTLIAKLTGKGILLGDNNYDSNYLYDLAGEHGHQLMTPPRRGAKALGHRRQSLYRLRSLRMIADGVGRPLLTARAGIERRFGSLGNFAAGLGPLPNYVRRLPRVRRWVLCKLIFNAVRIAENQGVAA